MHQMAKWSSTPRRKQVLSQVLHPRLCPLRNHPVNLAVFQALSLRQCRLRNPAVFLVLLRRPFRLRSPLVFPVVFPVVLPALSRRPFHRRHPLAFRVMFPVLSHHLCPRRDHQVFQVVFPVLSLHLYLPSTLLMLLLQHLVSRTNLRANHLILKTGNS